jgi:lysophospholipase L1-like esterase
MLGTNDLKHFLGATALEAANGNRRLVEIIRGHYAQKGEAIPEIIILSPPQLCDTDHPDLMRHFGGFKAIIQSKEMPYWYALRAKELGVHFFDASTVAKASPSDGVHLDAANTRAIGEGLVPLVKQVLGL